MSRWLKIVLTLIGCTTVAGLLWWAWEQDWFEPVPVAVNEDGPNPLPVPNGDQEVAWIHPATSSNTWEHFVKGAHFVADEIDGLEVDSESAFPDSTTAVPEVILGLGSSNQRLRIRWYKVTSRSDAAGWVASLRSRLRPPLAIIGGDNSARAQELAEALNDEVNGPLLLLTTATAVDVAAESIIATPSDPALPGGAWRELMMIYPERTFRFCFNNEQIAEAVIEFLQSRPELRPGSRTFGLEWADDPYSLDLSLRYKDCLTQDEPFGLPRLGQSRINYSTGQFERANPQEAETIDWLIDTIPRDTGERSLLILPIGAAPARRILHGLCAASPLIGEDLVAVTGDSISWNVVYRDRAFAWDIQSLPVPLVAFSHQSPVAWGSAEALPPWPHSTDDVLANADLVKVVVRAAFGILAGHEPLGLAQTPEELRQRMRQLPVNFFDSQTGDRLRGTGECIIYLRPDLQDRPPRIGAEPIIEIYQYLSESEGWTLIHQTASQTMRP